MKIIKQGNKHQWWVGKVGTCNYCDTQVEIEETDKLSPQQDRDGVMASVDCPTCKQKIWVYPNSSKRIETWKSRAAQHGCNVEEGDHECG
jgi:hypothetical protein